MLQEMSPRGRDGAWYSDDGQWVWDGQAWQPVPPMYASYSVTPEALRADVGSGFTLPFRDPEWATKILLQGLILLIPIVGIIAAYGWMLEYMDNLAQGRPVLPRAGFPIGRGFQLLVPAFVWGVVVSLPCIALYIALIALGVTAASSTATGNPSSELALLQLGVIGGSGLPMLLYLAVAFLQPALFVSVWRRGMGGGFQIGYIIGRSFGKPGDTLIAAVMVFAAGIIASLGIMLCFVGYVFTMPLAMAFMAGFFVWYAGRIGELQAQV